MAHTQAEARGLRDWRQTTPDSKFLDAFWDWSFSPAYSGGDFAEACAVAKREGLRVWERHDRVHWNVCENCPPFSMMGPRDAPDRRWTLVG